jgi:50S ribosomal subunit-associated GTPase HflX
VANKIDALDEPDRVTRLADRARALALPFFRVSAVTGEGVPALLEAAWPHIAEAREAEAAAAALHDEEQPRRKHEPVEAAPEDRPGEGRDADREAPPDDLPSDYNPALVPPVKGGGRGKGSRKR